MKTLIVLVLLLFGNQAGPLETRNYFINNKLVNNPYGDIGVDCSITVANSGHEPITYALCDIHRKKQIVFTTILRNKSNTTLILSKTSYIIILYNMQGSILVKHSLEASPGKNYIIDFPE